MRLTLYTDYSLRVLMNVGLKRDGLATIPEVAESYGISRNHLMKIVHQLGVFGYLENVRGRGGGFRLAKPPGEINLGEAVRRTEDDMALVQCFDAAAPRCAIANACVLRSILGEALDAFLSVLEGYTLEDRSRHAGNSEHGSGAHAPAALAIDTTKTWSVRTAADAASRGCRGRQNG